MTFLGISPRISSALRRLAAVGPVALVVGSVGAVTVSPPPNCSMDVPTGVSFPRGVRGACLARSADRTLFVQRSDEGLLIASIESGPAGAPVAEEERERLSVHGASARIVFCPTTLLDFASGAPTSACLTSTQPLVPGPGALVGSGTLRANLRVDGAGRTSCPTSARITATVTSPARERFDVTGSLAMMEVPDRPDSCEIAYDRIELDLGGGVAADVPSDAGVGSPSMGRRRLEQLMQLDDEQWRVVDLLLALTPQDWQAFEAIVESKAGSVTPPDAGVPVPPLETLGLPEVINTILSRVNAIRSNLDSVSSRIPDRADVRNLLGQVDLGRLRDMLDNVKDVLQGLVDIARDLRDGYESFDATQFRARLGNVLTDVESATTLYQRLLCIDDPDITIRQVSTAPLRRLLDRAPGVALYALSKILEAIDPSWDQRIANVVDSVPSEATSLCNDGLRPLAVRRVDAASVKCSALRPKAVGAALAIAKVKVSAGLVGFRYAKNHTKEEIEGTVGATAVAGGAAGTSVKNPVYETVSQWVDRLDNVKDAIKDVIDARKDCLDADKDVESDLKDCAKDGCVCTAPLSVILPGDVPPTYTYVARVVKVRIDQAEDAGLPNTADARAKYDDAVSDVNDETAAGYGLLCRAYDDLLAPTGISPGTPPPASPPGGAPTRPTPRRTGPRR
jgi:hypothetical protein